MIVHAQLESASTSVRFRALVRPGGAASGRCALPRRVRVARGLSQSPRAWRRTDGSSGRHCHPPSNCWAASVCASASMMGHGSS
jgi:hypothetical protein